MTDTEIIKALEYCAKQGITSECERCKVKKGCRAELIVNALDLINRQKAEIENLKIELQAMRNAANGYKREVEKLKKGINIELENYASEYDNKIKAEAVKEFVENLETALSNHFGGGFYKCHCRHVIDNLLKETVGDSDGCKKM